jgi:hypothetical protein
MFINLLISLFNILAVLFEDEIIKYFNLENKYSFLTTLFKIRSNFRKYYLF